MVDQPKPEMRVSVVQMIGEHLDGEKFNVTQEQAIQHTPGAPEELICAEAFKLFRSFGGLIEEPGDGTVNFYAASRFHRVRFVVKKIQLASNGPKLVKGFTH